MPSNRRLKDLVHRLYAYAQYCECSYRCGTFFSFFLFSLFRFLAFVAFCFLLFFCLRLFVFLCFCFNMKQWMKQWSERMFPISVYCTLLILHFTTTRSPRSPTVQFVLFIYNMQLRSNGLVGLVSWVVFSFLSLRTTARRVHSWEPADTASSLPETVVGNLQRCVFLFMGTSSGWKRTV